MDELIFAELGCVPIDGDIFVVYAKLKLVDDAGYWRHMKRFYITPIRCREI